MDSQVIAATRRALHGVAELVIAGPQFRAEGTIRLQVVPGGFGGVAVPVRVEHAELVSGGTRTPLTGTCRSLARSIGVEVGAPAKLYHDGSGVDPDERLHVDPDAAGLLAEWFARGDSALRTFAPELEPVLWPEHFDLAVTVDEVNYGVSPGDSVIPGPYAYVGPWTPRDGSFWTMPFGAVRTVEQVADAAALAAFFAEGRERAGD